MKLAKKGLITDKMTNKKSKKLEELANQSFPKAYKK